MNNVKIFRYRPQLMKADRFRAIAKNLRLTGEFIEGEEGMVMHNKQQILTWSQPNTRFGGVLYYFDRDRSLAKPARKLRSVESVKEIMSVFLERQRLMPARGKYNISVKLEARVTESVTDPEGKGEILRVPMRVDISSQIQLDGLPVMGPRAKVRASFGDREIPQFLHVGLWETMDLYKTGELIPKERLLTILEERIKNRGKTVGMKVRDINLAYWAKEYCGGADILEPYYFVEIEHIESNRREEGKGSGPRQVIQLPAYT